MSSREKTIVIALGVIILLALVGIGVLAAQLLTSDGQTGEEIDVAGSTASAMPAETATLADEQATPGATITPVAPPSMEGGDERPPEPAGGQPAVIVQAESVGPLAPAIIASQTLNAGRRYRVEITATDGSQVAIQGSWSQAATSASGQVVAPEIEFFEGTTPYRWDVEAPVADPDAWRISISASAQGGLDQAPGLVITIWDVTGSN
jgi:hypothetical protein